MLRSPRSQQWTDEACYHVMNCGHNREQHGSAMTMIAAIFSFVVRYQNSLSGLRLDHYCLMTNHFHLLVQLQRPADPSSTAGWRT